MSAETEKLIAQARQRAEWCRMWASRPSVKRPQVTPEWRSALDDVDALADALAAAEARERSLREALQEIVEHPIVSEQPDNNCDWHCTAEIVEAARAAVAADAEATP